MTYLYDHIQELRAELRACRMSRRERAQAEKELAQAIAEQAELDRAYEACWAADNQRARTKARA